MAQIFKMKPEGGNLSALKKCAELIRQEKLVVFPTETVYGLGANALNDDAVKKIFIAKGRPSDNPLIVHISNEDMLNEIVVDIPNDAKKLMNQFWPGPLTIIMKKSELVPDSVTCGLDTVAVRMPFHPIAHTLIKEAGVPIAAPSANISGRPSTTNAEHVIDDLQDRVDAIIDGGDADIGLESTVIDVSGKKPILLRPGGITHEELEVCLGKKVEIANPNSKKPLSPGMKYRHYAPKAKIILTTGKSERESGDKIEKLSYELADKGKVMILCSEESLGEEKFNPKCDVTVVCSRKDLSKFASSVFKILRDLDKEHYDYILVAACQECGIGLAIMNRLKKAASEIV